MTEPPAFDGFTSPPAEALVSFRMIGDAMYATITSSSITSVELHPMRQALLGALADAEGIRTLIVNVEQVEIMNSQALGMFVEAHSAAQSRKIRMLLAGVRPSVREMFEVTKLTRAFPVCSTPEELAAALGG